MRAIGRERREETQKQNSSYSHCTICEEKYWAAGAKEELLRAGVNQKHVLPSCHQERGKSQGGRGDCSTSLGSGNAHGYNESQARPKEGRDRINQENC